MSEEKEHQPVKDSVPSLMTYILGSLQLQYIFFSCLFMRQLLIKT